MSKSHFRKKVGREGFLRLDCMAIFDPVCIHDVLPYFLVFFRFNHIQRKRKKLTPIYIFPTSYIVCILKNLLSLRRKLLAVKEEEEEVF